MTGSLSELFNAVAARGDTAVVEQLLKSGADINLPRPKAQKPPKPTSPVQRPDNPPVAVKKEKPAAAKKPFVSGPEKAPPVAKFRSKR
ncbi:MAG TPA: ankyrin repeat domain-containing protein [Patescibacteria group bacterium]|nr:ankyrin repeat domain-containing protein [Patescibacteria group bacterium]